jgi:hypothetical protein
MTGNKLWRTIICFLQQNDVAALARLCPQTAAAHALFVFVFFVILRLFE